VDRLDVEDQIDLVARRQPLAQVDDIELDLDR
jgi:hypothetical protein